MKPFISADTNIFDSLKEKYPNIRVELYVDSKKKTVYLTGFIVPVLERGKGIGRAFMEDLNDIADQNGYTITLTPSDSYGGNVNRLKQFYSSVGFVPNAGKYKDFSHKQSMHRFPKGDTSLNENVNRMRTMMNLNENSSFLENHPLDKPEIMGDNIVYHGGDKKITKLDPQFIKGGLRANLGWGVYFTSSMYKATTYGKEITYLDISNLNILDLNQKIDEDFLVKIKELAIETKKNAVIIMLGALYEHIHDIFKDNIGKTIWDGWRIFSNKIKWDTDKTWSEMLLKLGYDGMQQGDYEYVIFNFDKANQYLIENTEMLNEYVRHRGNKWVVISKKGKTLGTHDTKEDALSQLRAIEAHKHMGEARSSDFISWKRKNVTIRGVREIGEENDAGAMLGRGLYTAFLSNKELARKYGKVYFVLGAIPKNPKVFNTLNDWEIWFYNTLVYKYSKEKGNEFPDKRDFYASTTIEDEMEKLGYDGIVIKGREMVNFKPDNNIKYFSTENELENYYNIVVNKTLDENDESLLNEKLTNIDDDVNMIYDMFFRKGVEQFEKTNILTRSTFKKNVTDTSILKTEECLKAHDMNPCTIWINNAGNHYDPNKKIISFAVSRPASDYVIDDFNGDIKKALEYLAINEPYQKKTLEKEFTEEKIKGSIHHELVHWIDDTFNNQHIKKRIDNIMSSRETNKPIPYNTITVNSHYMEVQAQIHNIKQLHNKHADVWDELSFEDMIYMSPPLTHVYKTLPNPLKNQWIKKIKLRMFREGLLGKKMFN